MKDYGVDDILKAGSVVEYVYDYGDEIIEYDCLVVHNSENNKWCIVDIETFEVVEEFDTLKEIEISAKVEGKAIIEV